jgi:hypothetical protein
MGERDERVGQSEKEREREEGRERERKKLCVREGERAKEVFIG